MKIYVASSWKNEYQPEVITILKNLGHEPYDFRNPAVNNNGFSWHQVTDKRPPWDSKTYLNVLSNKISKQGYRLDIDALNACEALIYILPCGRSASWEFGYAMGQGKPCYVLWIGEHEPDLMFTGAVLLSSFEELKLTFETLKNKGCRTCLNQCMDMDMDPYCGAVNKPWGKVLHRGRPHECKNNELWKPDIRRLSIIGNGYY